LGIDPENINEREFKGRKGVILDYVLGIDGTSIYQQGILIYDNGEVFSFAGSSMKKHPLDDPKIKEIIEKIEIASE
jgi:activator of 2-hydroxyglutaryl-CoA dehydratase